MYRDAWRGLRRILAIRLDNIGDVIMLGPALRALKQAAPGARLTVMVSRAGAQAASLLPWIDEVLVHRAVWQELDGVASHDPEEQFMLADALSAHGFDAAFIFTSFKQSPYPPAYIAYLAGIPIRVAQSKEWGGKILTHLVHPLPDETHQVDRNLHLLEAVGVPSGERGLEVCIHPASRREGDRLLAEAGVNLSRGYIVVAPGASCSARRWPLLRFAQSAQLLHQQTGLDIVVVGSAREADDARRLAERVGPRAFSLAGQCGVAPLAAVIEGADLLVCNDSAPMHLADATGTPMVVLFSGTELRTQFAPRSAPAVILGHMTPCSPCYRFECDRHLTCLDVTPDEVATAGISLLPREVRLRDAAAVREVVHA